MSLKSYKLRLVSHLVEHLEGLQQDFDLIVMRLQKAIHEKEGQGPFEHLDVIGQDGRGQGRPTTSLNNNKNNIIQTHYNLPVITYYL